MSKYFNVFALTGAILSLAGCDATVLSLEVLPPRTSASCSAPVATAPSFARGTFDVAAFTEEGSSYEADLRVTSRADLVVDEIEVTLADEDGATLSSDPGAYHVALGDVPLFGEEDDLRTAIVENVPLFTRSVLQDLVDSSLISNLDSGEFATVQLNMTPRSDGLPVGGEATFSLDLCDGCLLARPADEECVEPEVVTSVAVCRPGQDAESYTCAAPSSGGLFGG